MYFCNRVREHGMIIRELIGNLSIIVVLGVLYSFLYRKLDFGSAYFKILSGLLFGIIALLGMLTPLNLLPGIIFDGRSIIISIAGFFGGAGTALISAMIAIMYRAWLGGDGALMGVLVITSSAIIGTGYHYIRRHYKNATGLPQLYLFSLLVHIIMLLCVLALPDDAQAQVFHNIGLPVIIIYPVASVIICRLLLDQEKRIRDEKEKEVLLKEIHHRVKNNMQVISSLLNLQRNHVDNVYAQNLLNDSISRIQSMSLVHEILYKSGDFARINFKDYIDDLTGELKNTFTMPNKDITISTRIEDIKLTIEKAVPCGLIINELVSNAMKHAFLHMNRGFIEIRFFTTKNKTYIISIHDNGSGFNSDKITENAGTLGFQLVNSLTRQLGGTLDVDFNEGTIIQVEFS